MLLLLLPSACTPPPYLGDTGAAVDDSGPADTTPRITITWPAPESEVVACTLVLVEFQNFTIHPFDPLVGDPPDADGEGHWHAYWSGTYLGSYAPYLLVDMSDLEPGGYVITAELEGNEHDPVLDDNGDPIQDTVAVNLVAGDCQASTLGLP
jgi:hypothetical protein